MQHATQPHGPANNHSNHLISMSAPTTVDIPQPQLGSAGEAALARRRLRLPTSRQALAALSVGCLALMVLASLLIRSRGLSATIWGDEALSIGIASHPLTQIPQTLELDGSPPLYYILLHFWMSVAGRSEVSVHVLSLIFALLTIPVGFWAGRSLFGAKAGWSCAALCALSPYLTYYSTDARMYTLLVLCSLICCAAFVHAFVMRRRGYVWLFGISLAAVLYTHNWGLFLGAALGLAFIGLLSANPKRQSMIIDGVIGFGLAAVLYMPWLPSVLYQASHTGAPWAPIPSLKNLKQAIPFVMWGDGALYMLLAVFITALITLSSVPKKLRRRERQAAVVLIWIAIATLMIAWAYSNHTPAWASRYLGVLLSPLLLAAAWGIARSKVVGLVALGLVCILWIRQPPLTQLGPKSNAKILAAQAEPSLKPGDLVVVGQPETSALIWYYLPKGLRYATFMGPTTDPGVMDWRDAVSRFQAARVQTTLALIHSLHKGQHVVFIRPNSHSVHGNLWWRLIETDSNKLERAFDNDRQLRWVRWLRVGLNGTMSTLSGAIYERV